MKQKLRRLLQKWVDRYEDFDDFIEELKEKYNITVVKER